MTHCSKDLNLSLINNHFPHLTNKLFKDLILPTGLINNKPKINNQTKITIHNTNECIDDQTCDKLIYLVNVTENNKNKDTKETKPTKKTKPTRKHKQIKKRKPTKKKTTDSKSDSK